MNLYWRDFFLGAAATSLLAVLVGTSWFVVAGGTFRPLTPAPAKTVRDYLPKSAAASGLPPAFVPGVKKLAEFYGKQADFIKTSAFQIVFSGTVKSVTDSAVTLVSQKKELVLADADTSHKISFFASDKRTNQPFKQISEKEIAPGDTVEVTVTILPFSAQLKVDLVIKMLK